MNRFYSVLAVLICLALPTMVRGQNLLTDPGFESGAFAPNWSAFSNAFVEVANPPQFVPNTGNNLVSMFGSFNGGFGVSGIFQAFGATAGEVYTLDCNSRHFSGDPMVGGGAPADNWMVMKIAFFDAGGVEIGAGEATILDGNAPTDTWIYNAPVSATAPSGTVSVQALILYLQPGVAGGAGHVDDITFLRTVTAMPSYPGSGDDLRLASATAGGVLTTGAGNDIKTANAGDGIQLNVASPAATYDFFPYNVIGQFFTTGGSTGTVPGFPSLHISLANPAFILVDATAGSALGPINLVAPLSGSTTTLVTPVGLSGMSAIIQGLVVTPMSGNGFFAATGGHEIQFL